MSQYSYGVQQSGITYPPPIGYPLGTNLAFKLCTRLGIPILAAVSRRDWMGSSNIPQSGPAIAASNHLSYADAFFLAQFLYLNGRAPRFIGKKSVFEIPIIGKILYAAGQIPVDRETGDARAALDQAVVALEAGHLIALYPEGTLTRDENLWPMVGKTGVARLAILTRAPVIPIAAWGTQSVLPRYGKWVHLWPRSKVTYVAGSPLDLSPWYGRVEDPLALIEATAFVMKALTKMLEEIRQESAPDIPLDPRAVGLPRTGNYKKRRAKKE